MRRQQTTKLQLPMFKTLHDIEVLIQFLFTLLQNMKQQIPTYEIENWFTESYLKTMQKVIQNSADFIK